VSQLRLNPLTGRWVTVSVERATRPGDLTLRRLDVESDPDRPCPFCPGSEDATPAPLESYGPEGDWQVRVVPNLFPAFDGNEPMRVANLGPVFTQAAASGVHEVLVYTPDHDGSWADLDDDHASLAMRAIRDRMVEHAGRATVRYTQAIVNHGREAGASLSHPHGQVLGIPFVPGEIAEEEAGFRRFGEKACLLCTTAEAEVSAGHRLVAEDDHVVTVCPYWSGTPYEMLVMPRSHETHVEHTDADEVGAVGVALRDALRLLRDRVGDVPYNLVLHTAPHQHAGPFHWHVHVLPRTTSIAGFEQGTGVLINIVAPELAAAHLRR
jgi:UDPglucose--hexose-1-phosphate uridylyltransferase